MGRRPGPVEIIWRQGTDAFALLIQQCDFVGPERTDDGLTFNRPDLHVHVGIWAWKNEAGIEARVRPVEPATGE